MDHIFKSSREGLCQDILDSIQSVRQVLSKIPYVFYTFDVDVWYVIVLPADFRLVGFKPLKY